MISQTNTVKYALVGIGTTTTAPAALKDLADGQVGVFDIYGKGTSLASGEKFVVAIGGNSGKPAFVSEAIDPANVISIVSRGVLAAREQVSTLGYNGTTGSIASLTPATQYKATLAIQEYLASSSDGRLLKGFQYLSGAVAPTEATVASELLKSANFNFKNDSSKYLKMEMLCNNAGTAIGAIADTVVGSKGSKTVVITEVTAVATIAVGDYFRAGTATTDAIYKIVGSTVAGVSGTLTLDTPLVDAVNLLGTTAEFITAANMATAACGLRITGIETPWTVGTHRYQKVRFNLNVNESFGDTNITENSSTTAGAAGCIAHEGHGTYKQVAGDEWFCRGFEGEIYRNSPQIGHAFQANAVSGVEYDTTTIIWKDSHTPGFVPNESAKALTIYSPNGADYMTETAANNGVWLQLEAAVAASKLTSVSDSGTRTAANLTL